MLPLGPRARIAPHGSARPTRARSEPPAPPSSRGAGRQTSLYFRISKTFTFSAQQFATDAAFWDGTYTHEHEKKTCNVSPLASPRPKDEDCARITTGYKFAILYEVYTDDLQHRKLASQAGETHHPIHDDMFKDFADFFVACMYIHFYPTYTQMPYMLSTPYTLGPLTRTISSIST
jgi:hypothetical protein